MKDRDPSTLAAPLGRSWRRLLALMTVFVGTHACATQPLCEGAACACAVSCADGTECVAGVCEPIKDQTTAPITCETDELLCAAHEWCNEGTCVCDDEYTRNNDFACGCEAIDCFAEYSNRELCIDRICVCDPALHAKNDAACGCPNPERCTITQSCVDGGCECDRAKNLENSHDCACNGACTAGKVCYTGICVCPAGTISCGDACIPPNNACCGDSYSCPTGSACEATGSGFDCRPGNSQACYDGTTYLGYCPSQSVCVVTDGLMSCVPAGYAPCYSIEGDLLKVCAPEQACYIDSQGSAACLLPGSSVCPDEAICGVGSTCQKSADGYICHPNAAVACYKDGLYIANCPQGSVCTPEGACIPPGQTLCGDGLTTCPPGQACQDTGDGFACQPPGTLACFDDADKYTHWCETGHQCKADGCLLPGWVLCGDEMFSCPAGFSCMQKAPDLYDCHPNQYVPCFDEQGFLEGKCPGGTLCPNCSTP